MKRKRHSGEEIIKKLRAIGEELAAGKRGGGSRPGPIDQFGDLPEMEERVRRDEDGCPQETQEVGKGELPAEADSGGLDHRQDHLEGGGGGKMVGPGRKKEAVAYVCRHLPYSERLELFSSLLEAKVLGREHREKYNHLRPHSSLGILSPAEFGARCLATLRPMASAPQGSDQTPTTQPSLS